ncbi:predicted protein [Naegleria gruberi]|uniref:Predicted protein n=1 Tax=Naegleria gruberi TaxID=5762 RepID=D2VRM4_NAEGR|nr:uncharacterized protein NAEGRDRAFT_59029 [Naegleria gruberi]EFC40487.1 predicted protein [Naegleria gruberi]|eukprot:XP_002673231.1 predicted protein [Naegleria gruberi strain NEG-M]
MAPKITKSQLILSVKPDLPDVDDETAEQMAVRMDQHLTDLEKRIRDVNIEFLEWGEIRREEMAYGLKMLKVIATIHNDDAVPLDRVVSLFYNEEEEEAVMEGVSSCEIDSWNKL